MKKAIAIGAAVSVAGLAALGLVVGPELWNGYRFMEIMEHKAAEDQANTGPWPQLQDSCALCHGAQGRAANAQYPSLAGLSAAYIESQLQAFAQGQRNNPQMSPLAANLSDKQIRNLAAYYADQTPGRNETVAYDAATKQQGQAIVAAKACAACHGAKLMGGPSGPRLAGQGEIYLVDQLMAYKKGKRQDPIQAMNAIASTLSAEDIRAVARYIAGMQPSTN